jgi:N-ethylmaleimide reductase
MAITKTKTLFTPVQIGSMTLKHRVVMAPMSRLRAQRPSGSPSDLMLEYYSQRASDGGLQLTEATAVSATGRGYYGAPGIVVTPDGFTQPSPHRALETEEIAGIID